MGQSRFDFPGPAVRVTLQSMTEAGGYIYILQNVSLPESRLKIGRTTIHPDSRASDLSRATGVPTPFTVVWYSETCDCYLAGTGGAALGFIQSPRGRGHDRCGPLYRRMESHRLSAQDRRIHDRIFAQALPHALRHPASGLDRGSLLGSRRKATEARTATKKPVVIPHGAATVTGQEAPKMPAPSAELTHRSAKVAKERSGLLRLSSIPPRRRRFGPIARGGAP